MTSSAVPAGHSELECAYHDNERGMPVRDDRTLFEFLILEGAQAGLSWSTILRKRDAYRAAFDNFDAERTARYNTRKLTMLLGNPGIVRNRLKIAATVWLLQQLIILETAVERHVQRRSPDR